MDNTNYINLSRQVTLFREIEIISNNLANMDTAGYQAERMNFKEYISKLDPGKGSLSFVQTRNVSRNPDAGTLKATGNPFDLAIKPNNYFHIDTPLGERFTRAGKFTLNENSQMTTHDGFPLLDFERNPIAIPENAETIDIRGDGILFVDGVALTRIAVIEFPDPNALAKVGTNLYINNINQEYSLVDNPMMVQGVFESSNVNPMLELTKMIDTHRQFEAINSFIEREEQRQTLKIRYLGENK